MDWGRPHFAKKRRKMTMRFCPSKTRQRKGKPHSPRSTSEQDFGQSTTLIPRSTLALTSIDQNQPSIPVGDQEPNLSTLPHELLQIVFIYLSPCSAACVGLTCARMYHFFKQQYPNPIPLDRGVCQERNGWSNCCCENCDPWTITLGDLLEDCFLFGRPQYRLTDVYLGVVWRFLNVREFGNKNSPREKEDQLTLRYDDFFHARVEGATLRLLPNPFNRGDAWERDAVEMVLADRKSFESLKKWRAFWRGSWVFQRSIEILEKAVDEALWEEWAEGIELMGF